MKGCSNLKKVLLTKDGHMSDDSSDKCESEKKDAKYYTFETGAPLSSYEGDGDNLIDVGNYNNIISSYLVLALGYQHGGNPSHIYTNIKRPKGADPINLDHQIMSIRRPRLLQCRVFNTFSVQLISCQM